MGPLNRGVRLNKILSTLLKPNIGKVGQMGGRRVFPMVAGNSAPFEKIPKQVKEDSKKSGGSNGGKSGSGRSYRKSVGPPLALGILGGLILNKNKKDELYYKPGPLVPQKVLPVKEVKVNSKTPEGKEVSATICQNYYEQHPKDVSVLIAGGTGDLAYHNILYFLKIGADVTFTSRNKDALEDDMQELLEQLTDDEKSRLHCVITPDTQEGWLKLMNEVSNGKKEVHFNHLIGVPVHDGTKEAYDKALECSKSMAQAAKAFEEQQKEKGNAGKRIQFVLASSVAIDYIPNHPYAQFKTKETELISKFGPANSMTIKVPLVETPANAKLNRSTAFGSEFVAYFGLALGSKDLKVPITTYDDIGKAFASRVDGQFSVNAVSELTEQKELMNSISKAYGKTYAEILVKTGLLKPLAEALQVGHASPYAVEILEAIENGAKDVSDENYVKLLAREPQKIVGEYDRVRESGMVLPPPALRAHLGYLVDRFSKNPEAIQKLGEVIDKYGLEIACIAFEAVYRDPSLLKDIVGLSDQLFRELFIYGIKPTTYEENEAKLIKEIIGLSNWE